MEEQVKAAQALLKEAEEKVKERGELESQRNEAREKNAALKVENESLRKEMDEIKKRIDSLEATEGSAACPVCGQELSEAHRKSTLKDLNKQGKEKGDQFRANKKDLEETEKQITNYQLQITQLANVEKDLLTHSNTVSQLTERIESLQSAEKEWEKTGKKRLAEVTKILEKESFAADARKQLTKLDKELAKLGYDPSAHEAARLAESDGRKAEEEFNSLKSAKEISNHLESEIKSLGEEKAQKEEEVKESDQAYRVASQTLAESETQRAEYSRSRKANGAPCSKMKTRPATRSARRGKKWKCLRHCARAKRIMQVSAKNSTSRSSRHKTLERAFGKDGVPALLIEQALPQIEQKANDLLDRLSDGHMSIRFVTQAEYKDKKRDDLKETLDIQISDSAGLRNYEMYSGGEAFRVNFAIRLALSEILSQRKGARLQTLVIDEGFGSQDAQGRQRLIEAINLVKHDFAKILIITHLDELKDAFPNRIEVEKTERGSTVKVI